MKMDLLPVKPYMCHEQAMLLFHLTKLAAQ